MTNKDYNVVYSPGGTEIEIDCAAKDVVVIDGGDDVVYATFKFINMDKSILTRIIVTGGLSIPIPDYGPKGVEYIGCIMNRRITIDCSVNALETIDLDDDRHFVQIQFINTDKSILTNLAIYNGENIKFVTPPPETLEHLTLVCCMNLMDKLGENFKTLFPNLKTLIHDDALVSKLPTLPDSLLYLQCINGELETFPTLPPNIRVVKLPFNKLTKLGELPSSIESLSLEHNDFKTVTIPITLSKLCIEVTDELILPEIVVNLSIINVVDKLTIKHPQHVLTLAVSANQAKKLDLSTFTQLEDLIIGHPVSVMELDLTPLPKLTSLYCPTHLLCQLGGSTKYINGSSVHTRLKTHYNPPAKRTPWNITKH